MIASVKGSQAYRCMGVLSLMVGIGPDAKIRASEGAAIAEWPRIPPWGILPA